MLQRALDRPERGAGDLAVVRGGLQLLVAQEDLDHPDIDLLLQEVGGKAMSEAVQRDPLVDAGGRLGGVKGPVQLPAA